jgi:xanthine dehydrogenase small subunit
VILAGATDLALTVTKALQDPKKIIWIGRIGELAMIDDGPRALRLGAGVKLADAAPSLAAISGDLGEVMRRFGSVQVRAAGTVGGSIANASPIGDLAPCLIALGASLELRRGDAVRRLPLEDFFLGYRRTDRRASEFVCAVEIPRPDSPAAFRAYKVSKRVDEDISAVLGAFWFRLDGRRIAEARIAYGGMAATPARARNAERAAIGIALDDQASWQPALAALAADFTPLSDMRASAGYRSLVARNLLLKALTEVRGAPHAQTRLHAGSEVHHVDA